MYHLDLNMIDLKALLALMVVGQLGLSTARIRLHYNHDGVTPTKETRISETIARFIIPSFLKHKEVEKDVEKFKNFLINHRDAPVPAGELPIAIRRSHEVGQYVLIIRNVVAKLIAVSEKSNRMISPEKALNETIGESMSEYADDYKGKLQPLIDAVTHIQDDLEPIFKLLADLSKETDPPQQLAIYLKYKLDNKPNGKKLLFLLYQVIDFLKAANSGPISEEAVLVEQGAEKYVMLNTWRTGTIAQKASFVARSDRNIHTPPSQDEILDN